MGPLAAMPLPVDPPAPRAPLLPQDPTDTQLMLALARLDHPGVQLLPRPVPHPGDTLAAALTRVAAQTGTTLAAEDAARFAALDMRLQEPLLALFVTIETANAMFLDARGALTDEDLRTMIALRDAGLEASPEYRALAAQIDVTTAINAALLVTDTVEAVVVPALQDAVTAGAWPAAGVWDPVGVLRLGSMGDDVEWLDRIVQIDPAGNDRYYNNAGGATVFDPLYGDFNILTPVAVSVDFRGNEWYENTNRVASTQAGSELNLGFGLLFDLSGSDYYRCTRFCQAATLAVLRDFSGNDRYIAGAQAVGSGGALAILREDSGNEDYHIDFNSGGYGNDAGDVGILWDRSGQDAYRTDGLANDRLGWGNRDGRGIFIDEGSDADYYQTSEWPSEPSRHGCNDCAWERGRASTLPRAGGRGYDNVGGASAVIEDAP